MTPTTDQTTLGTCDSQVHATNFEGRPHAKTDRCIDWRPLAPAPEPIHTPARLVAAQIVQQAFADLPPMDVETLHDCRTVFERVEDQIAAALDAPAPAPEETARAKPAANRFDCVNCGVGIAADEDGCCAMCGRVVVVVLDHVPTYPPPDEDGPPPAAPEETTLRARVRVLEEVRGVLDRIVFSEVTGLSGLRLRGAERDDWIVRTTARKTIGLLREQIDLLIAQPRALSDEGAAPSPSSAEPSAEVPEEVREAIDRVEGWIVEVDLDDTLAASLRALLRALRGGKENGNG